MTTAPRSPKHSLRARITFASAVVTALGLGVAGVLMIILMERTLLSSLDESARSHGHDIAVLVEAGRLTNPLPSSGAAVAQVVDAENRVLASTPGGDQLVPIVGGEALGVVRRGGAVDLNGTRLGQPEPFRAVGVPISMTEEPQTVIVAVSLAEQQRTTQLLRFAVVGAGSAVAVAVALLCWFITGRTLRPVEELRRGAAEITGTGQQRLLPVPAARDELWRLATTLNDMLIRLEGASSRQRAFVADAAHELRSPIAALRTGLEVALAHPDAVDPHETAQEALDEVDRMGRLVDDMLVLARLEEGRRTSTWLLDMEDVIEDVRATLRDPRVPITVVAHEQAAVHGNPEALARMVRNLMANAVRHASSRVEVTVRNVGHLVELSVSNDGPGIAPRHRERVFERFTRLDDARSRDAGGTGLGLAIAREIARSHGGDLVVGDGDPGVCFTARLPGRSPR